MGLKTGIMGGTFDPLHKGHLIVAQEALNALELDEVVFIPAGCPRFKGPEGVSLSNHRLNMVKNAIKKSPPQFRVSELEIICEGPTYTVETLEGLSGSGRELYLVMGMDTIKEMPRWKEPEKVLSLAVIVGFPRLGSEQTNIDVLDSVKPGASSDIVLVDAPMIDISSTDIRNRVRQGRPIKHLVPGIVAEYIKKNKLYLGLD